jgi:hypothetical protein
MRAQARLARKGMKNANDRDISGYNANRQHSNYSEAENANT